MQTNKSCQTSTKVEARGDFLAPHIRVRVKLGAPLDFDTPLLSPVWIQIKTVSKRDPIAKDAAVYEEETKSDPIEILEDYLVDESDPTIVEYAVPADYGAELIHSARVGSEVKWSSWSEELSLDSTSVE